MPITVGGTTITFNDGTTQSTAGGSPTTAQVLTATAGASALAVGTYAVLMNASTTTCNVGDTIAGSSLRYNLPSSTATGRPIGFDPVSASCYGGYPGGGTAAPGTWRAMTRSPGRAGPNGDTYAWGPSFFLRIS